VVEHLTAALFVRPTVRDITNVRHLLQIFGKATGLMTNIQKSELYLIRCEGINQTDLNDAFQGRVAEFPCKYLGLPLHIGRTRRADEQILIDKIRGKTPWLERQTTESGWTTNLGKFSTIFHPGIPHDFLPLVKMGDQTH